MLTMETKSQNANLPSNSAGNGKNPPDPGNRKEQFALIKCHGRNSVNIMSENVLLLLVFIYFFNGKVKIY